MSCILVLLIVTKLASRCSQQLTPAPSIPAIDNLSLLRRQLSLYRRFFALLVMSGVLYAVIVVSASAVKLAHEAPENGSSSCENEAVSKS